MHAATVTIFITADHFY